jgi:hypothetical protein
MLTCKLFVNPTTEMEAKLNGIVHVVSSMMWYYELSNLLLRKDTVNIKTSAGPYSSRDRIRNKTYERSKTYCRPRVHIP